MTTWITEKDGKVMRIRQIAGEESPGPDWVKVPNDWGGSQGDFLEWFDAGMRRVPDNDLVKSGSRKDYRGRWYHKHNTGETKIIQEIDEEPGSGWTQKEPLPNEPYQKWDGGQWVIDTVKKTQAKKDQDIAEKKSAIQAAEQRIQRSLIAIQAGIDTEDDRQYFAQINEEIISLREKLREAQQR
jgi:hypothetical protein